MNIVEYTENLRHEVVEAIAYQMFTGEYWERTYIPRNSQPTRDIIHLKDKSASIDIETAQMLQFEAVHMLRAKATSAVSMCNECIALVNGRICNEGDSYEEIREKYMQNQDSKPSGVKFYKKASH